MIFKCFLITVSVMYVFISCDVFQMWQGNRVEYSGIGHIMY